MKRSDSVNELATALAKAQGEIKGAVKDSTNPHYKSQYADLASIWEACRAALTKHGLSVVQDPCVEGDRVGITTLLLHASGQWIEGDPLWLTPRDISPQSAGSAITYARRYALAAFVGVAPTDDDGEAAQPDRTAPRTQARPPKANGSAATEAVAKAKSESPDDVFRSAEEYCRKVPHENWQKTYTRMENAPQFDAAQKAYLYAVLSIRSREYELGEAADAGDMAYKAAILQETRPDVLAQMAGVIMHDPRPFDREKMLELLGKRELELQAEPVA